MKYFPSRDDKYWNAFQEKLTRCHLKIREGTEVFHLASVSPITGHNR